jgi:hypothetical protein
MTDRDLTNKLSDTAKIAVKDIPIVGQVFSVLADLHETWIPSNDEPIADAFKSESMLEDLVRRLSPHLGHINELDSIAWDQAQQLAELRQALEARHRQLNEMLSYVPKSPTHERVRRLLTSAWLELGLGAPAFGDDLQLVAERLDDAALWILLFVDDHHPQWRTFTVKDLVRRSKIGGVRRLQCAPVFAGRWHCARARVG